jgi:hypothetical protein
MSTKVSHPFEGARKMKPTLKHTPVIWECMLGTVYACAPERGSEVRYMDYDWEAARALADVRPERDPRVYRAPRAMTIGGQPISKGQRLLYVLREAK